MNSITTTVFPYIKTSAIAASATTAGLYCIAKSRKLTNHFENKLPYIASTAVLLTTAGIFTTGASLFSYMIKGHEDALPYIAKGGIAIATSGATIVGASLLLFMIQAKLAGC